MKLIAYNCKAQAVDKTRPIIRTLEAKMINTPNASEMQNSWSQFKV